MRKVLFILMLAMLSACVDDVNVTISNNCAGSYARIIDGRGRVVTNRLDYGHSIVVNVKEVSDDENLVRLTADGFTQIGDHPMGSTYTTIGASSSLTGTGTGSWEIYSFHGSSSYYCR